jgi:hypothetical protein
MSGPASPPHDELVGRPFSFYPPIAGIENNEWRLKQATWSEYVVVNTQDQLEVGVPRRFIGPVSEVDRPVVIVGLNQELEYRTGSVWPVKRTVLSMPGPAIGRPSARDEEAPEETPAGLNALTGSGSGSTDTRIERLVAVTLLSVVTLVLMVWALIHFTPEAKPTFVAKDQSYVELNRDDDYFSVLRKLGAPAQDRWRPEAGELQYRVLVYPERGYAIILMGAKQEDARYIGTMGLGKDGKGWTPIHSVEYARGASTAGVMRALPKF